MSSETILMCHDLSCGYDGIPVFEHLSFALNRGEYLCVVGENGSGKTTFLKTLLSIRKPMHGSIEWKGRNIGYVPQKSAVQHDFPASVEEVVLSGCLSRPGFRYFLRKEDHEAAERQMERLGMIDMKEKSFRDLSGGQQQRVLLARALCAADELLVLDEPATGLDPETTMRMYQMIAELNASGMTVVMITHDLAAAQRYATHVLSFGERTVFAAKETFFGEARTC